MDVREKYVMQKTNKKEKSICPNCIHHNLCIAENNQPCFECNRFIDANGVTVQEWISVKDMPFEEYDYKTVLYYDGKDVDACYVLNGNFVDIYSDCGRYIDGVTHWRPMPQPPKGE